MTNATRQAAFKARQLAAGLVHRELWIHPQDWPKVKEFARQLAKARKMMVRCGYDGISVRVTLTEMQGKVAINADSARS